MNNILRFTLILFLVNLVAASTLAGVYRVTKPQIDRQARLLEEDSLRQVMPENIGDRIEPAEEGKGIRCWKVFKGSSNRPVGYIFIAKGYGYSSLIEIMVGMKKDGEITGVRILNQNETPGLGAKIVERVSDRTIFKAIKEALSKKKKKREKAPPYFTEQFKALNVKTIELSKSSIQAITGATISSRACLDSIRSRGLEILDAK